MKVRVLFAPPPARAQRGAPRPQADECAVVVDVLRATTTLTVALSHGARSVRAAATPEEALALRGADTGLLLGGERDGRRVEGFDLGNSPFEYPIPVVSGRALVFASTNGSQALLCATEARRRVLGAFVNVRAVVDRVAKERAVVIVCSGKLGRFAMEDAACAGLLCERLVAVGGEVAGPEAAFARSLAPQGAAETRALVQGSAHGRYLRSLGAEYARDVEFCGDLDALDQAFEV